MAEFNAIEKIAQRRNLLQWLHEKVNVPRRLSETFAPMYGEQMEKVREVDTEIREWAKRLKPELKGAHQALKGRQYIDVAHYIGNLNDVMKKIVSELSVLTTVRGEHLDDFFSQHEQADLERQYFADDGLEKSAGLLDAFFGTERERAAKFLERMYHTSVRERKIALTKLVNKADGFVEYVFSKLKDLGTARASGDVGRYIKTLEDVAAKQKVFQAEFAQTYGQYVSPLVEGARKRREADKKRDEETSRRADESRGLEEELGGQVKPVSVEERDQVPFSEVEEQAFRKYRPSVAPVEGVETVETVPVATPTVAPTFTEVPDLEVFEPTTAPAAVSTAPAVTTKQKRVAPKQKRVPVTPPSPESESLVPGVGGAPIEAEHKEKIAQLLAYSTELEDAGDIQGSLEMIAIAEGLIVQ